MDSEQILKELLALYSEYRKELAATSMSANGSIFIGMATENDAELIKILLNLPSELRSRLLDFIYANYEAVKLGTMPQIINTKDESTIKKQRIKNLLLTSPHKEIEILIDRPTEPGREIHL